MYAKIENNTPVEWPVRDFQIRSSLTTVSLPAQITPEVVAPFGFEPYTEAAKPDFNALVEKIEERPPVKQGDTWVQQWEVVQLYSPAEREQVLADAAAKEAEAAALALKQSIIDATQNRLDTFAQTRKYDGILSLCTYATSTVPKFQQEGQYGVNARDATWAKLYEMLAEVEAGQRPVPSGYADIEGELPALVWP